VEFVVLLPVVLALLAVAWQTLLAGQAVWEVRVAARAAARAHAFGADAAGAARAHLRPQLERGLRVRTAADGEVRVSVRIPAVVPALGLGRVSATSHFRPQEPVEQFRCAPCGTSAGPRATHDAHVPEARRAIACGPSHPRPHDMGRTDHCSTDSQG
jgi:hypothetical protein